MKLRNRKTGEIGELQITEKHCAVSVGNGTASCGIEIYSSLTELSAEWEDVEEPKDSEYYWYIGYKNDIRRTKYHHISDFADNQVTATRKEIGNCFESLEEAEKAVEKLKAWKRLKDKGIEFYGWRKNPTGTYDFLARWEDIPPKMADIINDLDLLFEVNNDN